MPMNNKKFNLLVFASQYAFKGMQVTYLKRLYALLGIGGVGSRPPATESMLVKALVQHLKPDVTAEQMEEAVKAREPQPDLEVTKAGSR